MDYKKKKTSTGNPQKKERTDITPKRREQIYLNSKGKCVDCELLCGGGWYYNWSGIIKRFTLNGTHEIHHIIPLNMGGSSDNDNLILLCLSCHNKRHVIERSNNNEQ
jgi:5-methylcytosine-specific restriction endonuclease McrA